MLWSITFCFALWAHALQITAINSTSCSEASTSFQLSDLPYENYFYSDCHTSVQVVLTSPQPDSNLTIIGPRLLVAWPGGNSGIVAFFAPQNGINGSLAITLDNSTQAVSPVYKSNTGQNATVGISGVVTFNTSAVLSVAILGSIRTIRDFTEGPSILRPVIQNATKYAQQGDSISINRLWLDNITETSLELSPARIGGGVLRLNGSRVELGAGSYNFSAYYNYPQLTQLNTSAVLKPQSQGLITQNPDQTQSLSFLSYTNKLLAGAWRFLTYFGRDSMISALLLRPMLSEGNGSAIEAAISAVLERINRTDGSVCHEETIGDYATFLNLQNNITSTAAQCDYKMIDSDYYLPILIQRYFVNSTTGKARTRDYFQKRASNDFQNGNLTYADLAQISAEKIMNTSAPFARSGGQSKQNLIHLKPGEIVGEWRDSTYGIGGGRIPYDVNTALVPAALRAIGILANQGFFPDHPNWTNAANAYAQVWEDETLRFFEVRVNGTTAKTRVKNYTDSLGHGIPSNADNITDAVSFYGLALDGNNNQSVVEVMNTDDCFRLFLLNTTNQSQLSLFLSQAANHILQPFPVGLSTSIGLLVANPAYGSDPVYAANFTNNAYHGTVVWSWQLAMMAAGLERQLDRCITGDHPNFCGDASLYAKVKLAYNHLWDLIEANSAQLGSEVWSWSYSNGSYRVTPLGALPPPAGTNPTESDIRQLWSLTFLAVRRNLASGT